MTRRPLLLMAVALMMLLAACGPGSDDPTSSTATDEASDSGAPATETTTTTTEAVASTTTQAPSSSGGEGIPTALAEAFSKITELTSGRMEGSFEILGVEALPTGTSVSMPFSGAFDNEAGNQTFSMDMSGMAGNLGEEVPADLGDMFGVMEVRQIGETTYMSWPFFSFLGVETQWVSMPTDDSDSATAGFVAATPGNPADFLAFFEGSDASIEELGRETIRGVDTTHYLAIFDTDALRATATAEELAMLEAQGPLPFSEMPMDIWIGDDGLVYRYVIDIAGDTVEATPGQGFERMVMTFEMFDWGADIEIEVPPAEDITDSAELGALFGP